MVERHRLTPAQLAELSSGVCGATTMRAVLASQLSRRLLLISYLAGVVPGLRDALAVLDAARARDPAAAARVLSDAMVGAWLAGAVRESYRAPGTSAGTGQLAAVAAVAAADCGVDADLTLERPDGSVMIPTRGRLVAFGEAGRPVRLRVRDGCLTVDDGIHTTQVPPAPGDPAGAWLGLRRLTSGPAGWAMHLDDVSPYRDTYGIPIADRATDQEMALWRRLFAGAGEILHRYAADRAAETAGFLHTIVPLQEKAKGIPLSATAPQAYGALGATMPESPTGMASTLVHEAQHSKLNAVIQIEPLFDPAGPARYFAPWRDDPRPIWGLYHGVYAFLAVAETMNRLRAAPGQESAAESEFAKLREQLRPALNTLLAAPSLTEAGRIFAAGMDRRLAALEAAPVSTTAAAAAVRAMDQARARWRDRNGRAG